jgi:cobalt/nickel transport system permease protein
VKHVHIPDGYLTAYVFVPAFIVAIVWLAICIRKVKLAEKQVPILGLLCALFFAAMMMNWPVVGGTTAHLLGGASMGLILGPFAGGIGITVILVLQALLFGDGGLTTLGANVLNMGIIGVLVPCVVFLALYKIVGVKGNKLYAVIFVSAFAGDLLAAVAAGTELGFSQPVFQYGLNVAVPAMAMNHSIIGVGEGIITSILIGTLLKLRPDLLTQSPILKRIPQLQNKEDLEDEDKQVTEQKKQAKE